MSEAPQIPGLVYFEGFLPEEATVFEFARSSVPWDERIRARKTASYGVPYDYAGLSYRRAPFPEWLDRVRTAVARRVGMEPNNCLLNFYPDGDARMGFHSDSAMGLVAGTGVAIVSLGAQRSLRFRRIADFDDRFSFTLAPGSLLYMEPSIQEIWQHALPRTSRPAPRISLTFRAVAPEG